VKVCPEELMIGYQVP